MGLTQRWKECQSNKTKVMKIEEQSNRKCFFNKVEKVASTIKVNDLYSDVWKTEHVWMTELKGPLLFIMALLMSKYSSVQEPLISPSLTSSSADPLLKNTSYASTAYLLCGVWVKLTYFIFTERKKHTRINVINQKLHGLLLRPAKNLLRKKKITEKTRYNRDREIEIYVPK